MATRYQYGNLTRRKRRKGPDVWQFRWYENGKMTSVLIGTIAKLPRKADAERAVESLRMRINKRNSQQAFHSVTVNALVDRYKQEELSERHSTRVSYLSNLDGHILPRWGTTFLEEVYPMDVEDWLRNLKTLDGKKPLAPKTKGNIRQIMHVVFESARRWRLIDSNPVELVRQGTQRQSIPRFLTPDQFQKLLDELGEPYRTMVVVAACLGLRASEVMGLQWRDINWEDLTLMVEQGSVGARLTKLKNEVSKKPVPLDPDLATELLNHRKRSIQTQPTDFIFGSEVNMGKPRWQDSIREDHIKPAALRANLGKVGWHTFRHTYSTLLRAYGTDIKVQQELMRHADASTTLNIYSQAVTEQKREAVSKVARALLDK